MCKNTDNNQTQANTKRITIFKTLGIENRFKKKLIY